MANNTSSSTGTHKNVLWFNLNYPRRITLNKHEVREMVADSEVYCFAQEPDSKLISTNA